MPNDPTLSRNYAVLLTGDNTFYPVVNSDTFITNANILNSVFSGNTYSGENKFSDISGHWAADYINRAAERDWVAGYADNSFKPDQHITCAEAMTLINCVLERDQLKEMHLDRKTWLDCPAGA